MAITVNNITDTTGIRGVPADMALAKEVFSGLVLEAFERKNLALKLVTNKTIQSGSSTYFPVIAQLADTAIADYVVGADVSTSAIPVKERIITIDAPQYVSLAISRLEEKILEFETRSELANQMAEALATKIDKDVFSTILVASQTSGTIGGEVMQPDGSEVNNDAIYTGATAEAKGDALFAATFEANTLFKQKDVTGDPVVVTTPANFNNLVQSGKGVHRDFTSGANGGVDTGTIVQIAGIKYMWSNHLPVDTYVTITGETNKRYLQALAFTPECVGVVKLMDIMTEIDSLPTRIQEDLLKTWYWIGMGVLKPACACAITGGDTGVAA